MSADLLTYIPESFWGKWKKMRKKNRQKEFFGRNLMRLSNELPSVSEIYKFLQTKNLNLMNAMISCHLKADWEGN